MQHIKEEFNQGKRRLVITKHGKIEYILIWEKKLAYFLCIWDTCITLCRSMILVLSIFVSRIRRDGYKCQVAKGWMVLILFFINIDKLGLHFSECPSLGDSRLKSEVEQGHHVLKIDGGCLTLFQLEHIVADRVANLVGV